MVPLFRAVGKFCSTNKRFTYLKFYCFSYSGFYSLTLTDKIRNVRVMKKAGQICLYFDQEEDSEESSEKGVWTEKLLKFQEAKDCAGVFAILVGCTVGQGGEAK